MATDFVSLATALAKALAGATDLDDIKSIKAWHDALFAKAVSGELDVAAAQRRLDDALATREKAEVEIAAASVELQAGVETVAEVARGVVQ